MNEEIIRYVNAACEGDTDAMARLYSGTLKMSYYLALKLTGDSASAVEVTKKAYARAFCTITKLKKPEAFEIWMKQNIASVYKETQKFTFEEAEGSVDEGAMEFLSESVFETPEKAVAAVEAADSLKPEYRTALYLHYFCGMPVASLAKQLGVSESTVNVILANAREIVADACGTDEPDVAAAGALPVLTRLLQNQMAVTAIPASEVKDIFTYAVEIYNSFKHVEDAKASEGEPTATYFKSKAPSVPQKSGPVVPAKPSATQPEETAEADGIDYDRFVDEPVSKPATKKGFDLSKITSIKIGNLDFKKLAIIAAALLFALIIIVSIAKGGKKDKPKDNQSGTTQATQLKSGDYTWVPGGFDEVTDIQYLDEFCCAFRSVTTGKFGLLDYQGNILLQPVYDSFERCGYGKDYEGNGQYHTLVTIEGEQYPVNVAGGIAHISETAHAKHELNISALDKDVNYDERDRFFEGYAAAEKKGKWGYISEETGKKVIPYEYEAVNDLTGGQASYADYCRPVNNGLVAVKKNSLMGIINMNNDVIVPFEYSSIMVGDNGVFIAKKDDTWGVILVGDAINTFSGINLVFTTPNGVEAPEEDEATIYFCVADGGINVRSDAGSGFEKVGEIASGDEVEGYETKVADSGKTWIKVKLSDGVYGWAALSYFEKK